MAIASINPATGQTLKTFKPLDQDKIDHKLQLAAETYQNYKRTRFEDREQMMFRAAEVLEANKLEFAKIMTAEMGKPLQAAVSEAEKCAWVCRYYAETAKDHLADQFVETNASKSYVKFQPLGPVLAVMPWNFPFWQVFRFAAPALMAGNVGLLKHASNVPQCALAIEEIFRRAGFPEGTFQTLRTLNNGQSCIAAKRFIVASEIYDQFERAFVDQMTSLRVGDPMEESTDIGPLATPQIVNDLEKQVKGAVAAGARVLTGGKRMDPPGNFFEPTALTNLDPAAPVSCEEIFGPVATLFRVETIDEAIRLANSTPFGLGSAAWTNDPREQTKFIEEIEAGCVFINGMVASDPRLPFGGIKNSGYGRELAEFGIREFVNIKTVWIV
jgi:acyl-CoA reductase-like NAD-dependent aldehyde dehydrogenase